MAQRIHVDTLQRWQQTTPIGDGPLPEANTSLPSKFPFAQEINEKIILWEGDITRLDVDAIVNSTNETLSDRTGISGAILKAAGPELIEEIAMIDGGCRTGESKITKGHNLPARFIIHTVSPRYNPKYQTAAENALHSCYRSSLQLLKENALSSIAFCTIYSEKRGYPLENGTHIALRTVRRFLEHWGNSITTVVFVTSPELPSEAAMYQRLLPLYFPRSPAEELRARSLLPEDTGNEIGETVVEERKIRIGTIPIGDNRPFVDPPLSSPTASLDTTAAAMLATLQEDPDVARRRAEASKPRAVVEAEREERLYASYLQRARREDLSDIARRNIIYQSGVDMLGRPIVVVVGCRLATVSQAALSSEDVLERVLLYLLRVMDPIVDRGEYVVVYFHANMDHKPDFAWLRKVHNIFDRKYGKNMSTFYLVHPTIWLKLAFTLLRPFLSSQFTRKIVYLDSIAQLLERYSAEQLNIPQEIIQFERKARGEAQPADTPNGTASASPVTPAPEIKSSTRDFHEEL